MSAARARIDVAAVLREAAGAAAVGLVLAIPLIGLQTVDRGGTLGIETRWPAVAVAVAAVFVVRLLFGLARRAWPGAGAATGMPRESLLRPPPGFDRWAAVVLLAIAIIVPMLPFATRRTIDLGTTVLIYVMLGWGLNVVVGLAGLLDLGYVAFYAVGAYSYAILAREFGLSFWECLPLAGAFAALFGILLGFPVLRLRGDYLAIVTLGFGEMIRIVLINFQSFTGGPNGIYSIPRPTFFGYPFGPGGDPAQTTFHELFGLQYTPVQRFVFLYYVIIVLAAATFVFTERIRRLPVGRAWEALREDEIACRALGVNPTNTKLTAFAIGAMFGGFAGAFFATAQGFISPESFTFSESAIILAIVVLGGMGSQLGVMIAAAVLVLLPELGREFGTELVHLRMLLFGAAMILIMVVSPRGLIAVREPSIRLGPARAAR